MCFEVLDVLWIRTILMDCDLFLLMINTIIVLYRVIVCMSTLHYIVNVFKISCISCPFVRPLNNSYTLLLIYHSFLSMSCGPLDIPVFILLHTLCTICIDSFDVCFIYFHYHNYSLSQ